MESVYPHVPVMLREVLEVLDPQPNQHFVDGTLGAGGHSEAILERIAPSGTLTAFDLDEKAIAIASPRLARFENRVRIIHDSYTRIGTICGENTLDGFLVDLGVSSMQIDDADRGFSFLRDGSLDMRFSASQKMSAADFINTVPEEEISRVLWLYGEEKKARKIAAAIGAARKKTAIKTTLQLADIIAEAVGKHEKIHPATRSFQAIRIAVNGELDAVEMVLPAALKALKPGGRMAVISFHSLEDRIVKQFFKTESRGCICPPERPVCTCGHHSQLKELTRHPLTADGTEILVNPRSRSAKLRAAVKLQVKDGE